MRKEGSSLIFVGMYIVKGMIGFSFHLFSLELIVFVDSFSNVFETSVFGSIL